MSIETCCPICHAEYDARHIDCPNCEGDLIARLENGDGPDRELDALVYCAVIKFDEPGKFVEPAYPHHDKNLSCKAGTYWLHNISGASLQTAPELTASVDASLALVEQTLPDYRVASMSNSYIDFMRYGRAHDAPWRIILVKKDADFSRDITAISDLPRGEHKSLPRAIDIAALKAHKAQEAEETA